MGANKGTRFKALERLRPAVCGYCGGSRAGMAAAISNRDDHGNQCVSGHY
jgi:hypothetical protein